MTSGVKETFNKNSVWYKKRTNLERRLILVSILVFLIALALIIAISVIVHRIGQESRGVCSTTGCIHAASSVLEYIDESVQPCDDFYKFACGNYLKTHNIPEDKSGIGSFTEFSDIIRDQLKAILDEPLPPRASKTQKYMKEIYNLCMNLTAIEEHSVTTVKSYFKELGGWPLLEGDNWNGGTFDWKKLIYKARKLGLGTSYFLSLYTGIDEKNSTRRCLYTDQASLGMSREFLIKGLEEKIIKAYYDYMVDISVLFGADRTAALSQLKETLDFEIQLAKISLPKEERRNATALYNPMTVEQLMVHYSSIPWLEYINKVLDIPNIEITEDEMIIVSVPKYITDLDGLLRRTPKRVLANYVLRRIALSMVGFLPNNFRDRQTEYNKVVSGQGERRSRWKECTDLATGSVSLATGAAYVRKYFKDDSKAHAVELVSDIRSQFVKTLETVEWMDEVTRKNALEKAAAMMAFIAYPDELLDDKKVEKYYSNLDLPSNSYIKSIKSLVLFYLDYQLRKFRLPVNKTDWIDHSFPTTVNAFYSSMENSIEFPAGILQGTFFDASRPRYMNYGGIGYVIGHEITHGFDDQGRQFDKDGNLNEWWEDSTRQTFIEKAQCIIDQYGNYTVPEVKLNLNGINTQGENIADNGGIKMAYLAYQSWTERNGAEQKLPGMSYTPNQLFWISAANIWCSKIREESLKLQVSLGYHSPSQYRIIGPFSNSEYFAKDFNCPSGSKMNPVHKCHVW